MDDLLGDTKFVKLTSVANLQLAEAIKAFLRQNGVAAVIIGDEKTGEEGGPPDTVRIEVPEQVAEKARALLNDFYDHLARGKPPGA
ncbi:MAG: putative signal transducing protein [Planctomycetota bacterium]|jgi:hypothetical protein